MGYFRIPARSFLGCLLGGSALICFELKGFSACDIAEIPYKKLDQRKECSAVDGNTFDLSAGQRVASQPGACTGSIFSFNNAYDSLSQRRNDLCDLKNQLDMTKSSCAAAGASVSCPTELQAKIQQLKDSINAYSSELTKFSDSAKKFKSANLDAATRQNQELAAARGSLGNTMTFNGTAPAPAAATTPVVADPAKVLADHNGATPVPDKDLPNISPSQADALSSPILRAQVAAMARAREIEKAAADAVAKNNALLADLARHETNLTDAAQRVGSFGPQTPAPGPGAAGTPSNADEAAPINSLTNTLTNPAVVGAAAMVAASSLSARGSDSTSSSDSEISQKPEKSAEPKSKKIEDSAKAPIPPSAPEALGKNEEAKPGGKGSVPGFANNSNTEKAAGNNKPLSQISKGGGQAKVAASGPYGIGGSSFKGSPDKGEPESKLGGSSESLNKEEGIELGGMGSGKSLGLEGSTTDREVASLMDQMKQTITGGGSDASDPQLTSPSGIALTAEQIELSAKSVLGEDTKPLFERVHDYVNRCTRKGCVQFGMR